MKDGRQAVAEAKSGDHVIFMYEDSAELFTFMVQFIKDGLANGERCMYVVSESTPAEVIDALSRGGIRVDREIKRGAFAAVTAREYFGLPPFHASRAIERVLRTQAEAVSAGFAGLRIAADWAWTLIRSGPDDGLSEFESLLDKAIGPGSLTAACMYRRDGSDPAALERLARTHRKVIASNYVLLSLSALFRNLARTDLRGLAQSARESAVREGEFYFRQGAPATDVYMLTSGAVKLVRTDADGRSLILRIVLPMQPFGDRCIALGSTVHLASGEAMEDSRALVWGCSAILQIVLAHPAVSRDALRLLEDRVETERKRLEDFVSPDVARRLARLLLRLGQHIGRQSRRGVIINVPFSRQDLAELVITSPYTVSRILAEWRRLDILDAQRTRILILDQERLVAIAERRASAPRPGPSRRPPPSELGTVRKRGKRPGGQPRSSSKRF